MNDLLPILSGLIVISALAVVSSGNNDKEVKEVKEVKERKEKKEYKPREKKEDNELSGILKYFKNKLSVKKRKPKRYHKIVNSRGKTERDSKGVAKYILKEDSR
jgi:hypothetical protein